MYIQRSLFTTLGRLLTENSIVFLYGPPRSGKSSLAGKLVESSVDSWTRIDLADSLDARKLDEPEFLFRQSAKPNFLIDSVGKAAGLVPELLTAWEGAPGRGNLLIVSDTLPPEASRQEIGRAELCPLKLFEVGKGSWRKLWVRGGFPESFYSGNDEAARLWGESYAFELAERRLPAFGLPSNPQRYRSLLSMLARSHGLHPNFSAIARSLGLSSPTVAKIALALESLGIIRLLPSLRPANGKRLLLGPKLYFRDSGFLHALLGISDFDRLAGDPVIGSSWEGFGIEQAREALPEGWELSTYGTRDGSSIGLSIRGAAREGMGEDTKVRLVAEFRYAQPRLLPRGNSIAAGDLGAKERYIVLPEIFREKEEDGFRYLSLAGFLEKLGSI